MKTLMLTERITSKTEQRPSVPGRRESLVERYRHLINLLRSAAGELSSHPEVVAESLVGYQLTGATPENATRVLSAIPLKIESIRDFADNVLLKFISEATSRYITDVEIDKLDRTVNVYLSEKAKPHVNEMANYPLGVHQQLSERRPDSRGKYLVKYKYEVNESLLVTATDAKGNSVTVTAADEIAGTSTGDGMSIPQIAPDTMAPQSAQMPDTPELGDTEPVGDDEEIPTETNDEFESIVNEDDEEDFHAGSADLGFDGASRAKMRHEKNEEIGQARRIAYVLREGKLDDLGPRTIFSILKALGEGQSIKTVRERFCVSSAAVEVAAMVMESYRPNPVCESCAGNLKVEGKHYVCQSCSSMFEKKSVDGDEGMFAPGHVAAALGQQYHAYQYDPEDDTTKDVPFPDFKTKKPGMGKGGKGVAEKDDDEEDCGDDHVVETCHMCSNYKLAEHDNKHWRCESCGFVQEKDLSEGEVNEGVVTTEKGNPGNEPVVIEGAMCPKCDSVSTLLPMGETARCIRCQHHLNLDEMRRVSETSDYDNKYTGDGEVMETGTRMLRGGKKIDKGDRVDTPEGEGSIVNTMVLGNKVLVKLDNTKEQVAFKVDEIEVLDDDDDDDDDEDGDEEESANMVKALPRDGDVPMEAVGSLKRNALVHYKGRVALITGYDISDIPGRGKSRPAQNYNPRLVAFPSLKPLGTAELKDVEDMDPEMAKELIAKYPDAAKKILTGRGVGKIHASGQVVAAAPNEKQEAKGKKKTKKSKSKKSGDYDANKGNDKPADPMIDDLDSGGEIDNPLDTDKTPSSKKSKKESVVDDDAIRAAQIIERKMLGLPPVEEKGGKPATKSEGGVDLNKGEDDMMPSDANKATKMPDTDSDNLDKCDDKGPKSTTQSAGKGSGKAKDMLPKGKGVGGKNAKSQLKKEGEQRHPFPEAEVPTVVVTFNRSNALDLAGKEKLDDLASCQGGASAGVGGDAKARRYRYRFQSVEDARMFAAAVKAMRRPRPASIRAESKTEGELAEMDKDSAKRRREIPDWQLAEEVVAVLKDEGFEAERQDDHTVVGHSNEVEVDVYVEKGHITVKMADGPHTGVAEGDVAGPNVGDIGRMVREAIADLIRSRKGIDRSESKTGAKPVPVLTKDYDEEDDDEIDPDDVDDDDEFEQEPTDDFGDEPEDDMPDEFEPEQDDEEPEAEPDDEEPGDDDAEEPDDDGEGDDDDTDDKVPGVLTGDELTVAVNPGPFDADDLAATIAQSSGRTAILITPDKVVFPATDPDDQDMFTKEMKFRGLEASYE